MNSFTSCHIRSIFLFLLLILVTLLSAGAHVAESRDMLLHIVTDCIDVNAPDYCITCLQPRADSPCAVGRECKKTTEVWQETTEYVVVRDRKMCGCAQDFVHGLAIPRRRVLGIEDPRKPDGIWDFTWAEAKKRIKEDNSIALAVNPSGTRSQDQLHIHIVRLQNDARGRFPAARLARITSIEGAWSVAAQKAAEAHFDDYGVLVAKHPDGGFLVVVDDSSIEKMYTQWKCQ